MVQKYGHSIKVSGNYTSLEDDCRVISACLQNEDDCRVISKFLESKKSEIGKIASQFKSLNELVQETLDGKFFDEEST